MRLAGVGGYERMLDVVMWVFTCFDPSDNHAHTDAIANSHLRSPLIHASLVADVKSMLTVPKFSLDRSAELPKPTPQLHMPPPKFSFRSRYLLLEIIWQTHKINMLL